MNKYLGADWNRGGSRTLSLSITRQTVTVVGLAVKFSCGGGGERDTDRHKKYIRFRQKWMLYIVQILPHYVHRHYHVCRSGRVIVTSFI